MQWRAVTTASSAAEAPKSANSSGSENQPFAREVLVAHVIFICTCSAQGHNAAAGARQYTPVRSAAARTAQATAPAVHPGTEAMAVKRLLAQSTARRHDDAPSHGPGHVTKYCTRTHMPRPRGPTHHLGRSATPLSLGDITQCWKCFFRRTLFQRNHNITIYEHARYQPPCRSKR